MSYVIQDHLFGQKAK